MGPSGAANSNAKTHRTNSNTISLAEYKLLTGATPKSAPTNKFKAIKTKVDDVVFDSKGEAVRFGQLQFMERAGLIHDLERQVRIPLIVNGRQIETEDKRGRKHKLFYLADYSYYENGKLIYEDFKGHDTPVSRLKRAIVEAQLGVTIRVTRRSQN